MSLRQRFGLGGGNWHRIYDLLALFAVITLAGGLWFTYRTADMFHRSLADTRAWERRQEVYSGLAQLASDVNAPGNDVFDNPDIALAERRLAEALSTFNRQREAARGEALHALTGPTQKTIVADLDAIAAANDRMVAEAQNILEFLLRDEPALAGGRMAVMDRRYAELNRELAKLRHDALVHAAGLLDQQERELNALHAYQGPIGVAILLMIAAATTYGRKVARRIKANAVERDGLVRKLSDSEARLERRVTERTDALSTANQQLARLAAIVTTSDDAIVSVDTDGRVLTWNPAATRLFGYDAVEIIGQPASVIVPEHRRSEHREIFARAIHGDSLKHHQTERQHKDGSLVPVDLTVSAIRGDDGRILGGSEILRDIGDKLRTESQLAEAALRLSEAQRMARLGSWELDLATQAVTWSDEMFRLFGLEPGEIVPTYETFLGLLHPDDRESSQSAVARSVETGEPFERDERVVRGDGAELVFHTTCEVIVDEQGRPLRLVGTAQDVTQLRAAEVAVRRSKERFQYAARATNEGLWDWDVATNTIWRSEGFLTMFSHKDPRPTREFSMSLIHPDDAGRIGDSFRGFLESSSEFWTDEYRCKRADGTYAWILDRGYAIRNREGKPVRMIGSMMDITERKQSERMKSDFVSFVSHQLRTPLSGMSWMLELAADAEGLPEDARAHIADARESGARLATLVNDLLDIAKLESGRLSSVPEPLALSTLTRSVVAEIQPLATDKALTLEVTYDPSARPVFADSQLLRQVVTNLLSNAMKYTPAGGRIDVLLREHDGSVTWAVRDTGVGVPRGAQARLFEKFYRADNAISMDAEGTGLGLHLVRLIVEQAGGRVWCESEEGQGATFAFTLPAMAAEEEAT